MATPRKQERISLSYDNQQKCFITTHIYS